MTREPVKTVNKTELAPVKPKEAYRVFSVSLPHRPKYTLLMQFFDALSENVIMFFDK